MMPPVGMPHPDPAVATALASMLETKLDEAGFAKPNPGPPTLRRLTRTEYGNAVRDLLGLDVDVSSMLPGEGYSNEGFDNDSDSLGCVAVADGALRLSGLENIRAGRRKHEDQHDRQYFQGPQRRVAE